MKKRPNVVSVKKFVSRFKKKGFSVKRCPIMGDGWFEVRNLQSTCSVAINFLNDDFYRTIKEFVLRK